MTTHTIEALLMPDGSITLSEPLHLTKPLRVLVTVLEEPTTAQPAETDHDRLIAALMAAGLLGPKPTQIPMGMLSATDRATFAQQIGQRGGTPLSQIILDDRVRQG